MYRRFFLFFCVLLWACGAGNTPRRKAPEIPAPGTAGDASSPEGGSAGAAQRADASSGDDAFSVRCKTQAAALAASLDDRLLAAQVIMAGLDNKNYLSGEMKLIFREIPPGAIVFFKYNLNAGKDEVRSFLRDCSELTSAVSGILPFLAVDHEGGMVHRFGPGVEKLPAAASFMELAGTEGREAVLVYVEEIARISAAGIRDLGITMNLAPVAEVLNDENRAFLETRSYGPDPEFTEAAAAAFIRGMDAAGIACAVKHFPGNSGDDPHSGAAVLKADRAALEGMAKPFAGIIRSVRPAAVMVSHVMVPVLDPRRNASLSPLVMGWIRELGFSGIILADDFSMGAVSSTGLSPEAATVEALNAGVDMIMTWPRSIAAVHGAILDALEEGRLPRRRLREAAEHILAEKIRYGLMGPETGVLP
jgi:beta-N-acetylhexosaminidase